MVNLNELTTRKPEIKFGLVKARVNQEHIDAITGQRIDEEFLIQKAYEEVYDQIKRKGLPTQAKHHETVEKEERGEFKIDKETGAVEGGQEKTNERRKIIVEYLEKNKERYVTLREIQDLLPDVSLPTVYSYLSSLKELVTSTGRGNYYLKKYPDPGLQEVVGFGNVSVMG